MKIVINSCFGGFGISEEAWEMYLNKKNLPFVKETGSTGLTWYSDGKDIGYYESDLDRSDPDLIGVIEKLGKDANGWAADLKIIEIPDDVEWEIGEYDGREWVAEKHRTWD